MLGGQTGFGLARGVVILLVRPAHFMIRKPGYKLRNTFQTDVNLCALGINVVLNFESRVLTSVMVEFPCTLTQHGIESHAGILLTNSSFSLYIFHYRLQSCLLSGH